MKSLLFQILVLSSLAVPGQGFSKESFVNQVSGLVVDSSFSKYYLSSQANPCRFKHFDYGELIKYGLRESVTLGILNELSRHVYEDTADLNWVPGKIDRAICVGSDQILSILDPTRGPRYDPSLTEREKQRAIKKLLSEWDREPQEEKLVYYFSRPEFTDDGQYAVIDLDFRCDEHQCGSFATYFFRQDRGKWKAIGMIPIGEGG
jgi:hypothetical protein